MPVVPYHAVTDAWNELNAASEPEMAALVERFRVAQPVLSGWLKAGEDELGQSDDRGMLYFYGLWIWNAWRLAGGDEQEITVERIEVAEAANEREVEELAARPDANWLDHARGMTREYRQMALLGAITESLMDPGLTDHPRSDDLTGLILLKVKTVIDVLDT